MLPDVISDPSESALLPSEGPKGRDSRVSNEFFVFDDNIIGLVSSEEIFLNKSSNLNFSDLSVSSIVVVEDIVSGVRVQVEHSNELGVVALEDVERLESVHVSARGEAVIDGVGLVESPSGVDATLFVLVEETSSSFSHSHKREVSQVVH